MKTLNCHLTCLLAGLLLSNCSSTSHVKRSGDNFSLERISEDESVVIATIEFQGYVKAVNMYNSKGKLVKSINNNGQSKANLNVIVKPGQYYLMVIYSDGCELKEKFSLSTATNNRGQDTFEDVWSSPPDDFLKFDVPGSSLVNLGAYIVHIDAKTENTPSYGFLRSCRFTLYHDVSNVIEEFKTRKPEIYQYFKDKIVTVNSN